MFAGVGKTDEEIPSLLNMASVASMAESEPEIDAIEEIAKSQGDRTRGVAREPGIERIPITTSLLAAENKFGISLDVGQTYRALHQFGYIDFKDCISISVHKSPISPVQDSLREDKRPTG